MIFLSKWLISRFHVDVSENSGTPKSSIFNRVFHYFHHPFWGTLIFGNTHVNLPGCNLTPNFLISNAAFRIAKLTDMSLEELRLEFQALKIPSEV